MKNRKEKGITLIALIITIIVLVILAAVSISAVYNSKIVEYAINGTYNYTTEALRENKIMEGTERLIESAVSNIDSILGGNGESYTPEQPVQPEEPTIEIPQSWDKNKVYAVKSEDNIVVPVPKEFTVSEETGENKVETGFVIKQGENEFVWVPVAKPSTMFTTDNEGNPAGQLYEFSGTTSTPIAYSNTGAHEPDILTDTTNGDAVTGDSTKGIEQLKNVVGITGSTDEEVLANWKSQLQREFNEMKTSVETYGGFYIGRYETGNLSQAKSVVAKGNSDISNVNWYKMYVNSKTITDAVTSSMIWGCQWDATLRWFQTSKDAEVIKYVTDGTGKGNYKKDDGTYEKAETGSNVAYRVNNIYDMAGNVWDWTLCQLNSHIRELRRWELSPVRASEWRERDRDSSFTYESREFPVLECV